ncbi:TPA: hypothetical protein DDZ10_02470 [Candidatus Uhrbacteria bacterium]|nr:MAG: hypothetical protein UY79_C0001G0008 [Parcubacteria group bacterium GW2011_GWA2_53_21]OGL71784.1 MAG: hypothetical protein A3D69_01900 [Candidatus Uhrbacteria bacterium RIFCSPHIGHO2_02_FULL_54_11]HBL39513.1 hypothetical protein [Candidatus Uhrbacteria bacterium]
MSHTPNYDAKVKSILDATSPGERTCELTGEKWEMTEEEIGWYKKFNVPPSKRSPLTRAKITSSFWVGFQWWNWKHPKSGVTIISPYHPATGVSVLPDKEWFDQDFSSEYLDDDPNRSVFDVMYELTRNIPLPAHSHAKEPENSVAILSHGDRNSYFSLGSESEQSLFVWWSTRVQTSCLVWNSDQVAESYSVANSKNIHNSLFVRDSSDVLSSAFCFLCEDIESCFGATNQSHQKFIFFNEQLSESEFHSRREKVDLSKRSELEKWMGKFRDLVGNKTIWPENLNAGDIQSTGEYLYDVSDCHACYACVKHSKDLFYCSFAAEGSDSAFSTPIFSSKCFEATNQFQSHDIRYSYACYRCQSMEYSYLCYDCEDCFGCVGLHRKKNHIFNKSYAEDAYWQKLDEIKCRMLDRDEYGQFFPIRMSPTYFGEAGAVNHFGADLSEWERLGGTSFDPESAGAIGDLAKGDSTPSCEIPDAIDEMKDKDWVGRVVLDEAARRKFRFLKPELDFYRRKKIAPPTRHFTWRMIDLLHESNLAVFEDVDCAKCSQPIRVAKNMVYPNRTIYCKPCYLTYLEQHG